MAQKPTRPKPNQGTIKTYRPGIAERATDSTIGALVRQAHKTMGASEKDAAREANRVLRNVEEVTGLRALEESAKRILNGKGNKTDYAVVGASAIPSVAGVATRQGVRQGVRRGARVVDEAVLGQRVRNQVVPAPNPAAKPTRFDKRPLTSAEQIKYASRKMSPAELADAMRTGRFKVPKDGSKFNQPGSTDKWWSPADDAGTFGRSWNWSGTVPVRLPIGKVPANRAARTKYAEVFDEASGSWKLVKRKAKGGAVKDNTPTKKRGDGIAQRGKTRGKVR